MRYKVAFIVTVVEEIQSFLSSINASRIEKEPFAIYRKDDVLICAAGFGLTNTAAATSYLHAKYNPMAYANIGLTGSRDHSLKKLDCIIPKRVYSGYTDCTNFGYEYGQIAREKPYYEIDKELLAKFDYIMGNKTIFRNLISSNIFVDNVEKFDLLVKPFEENTIQLFDMEAHAVFAVADKLNRPCISIKFVVDILGYDKVTKEEFIRETKLLSEKISNILQLYTKQL